MGHRILEKKHTNRGKCCKFLANYPLCILSWIHTVGDKETIQCLLQTRHAYTRKQQIFDQQLRPCFVNDQLYWGGKQSLKAWTSKLLKLLSLSPDISCMKQLLLYHCTFLPTSKSGLRVKRVGFLYGI